MEIGQHQIASEKWGKKMVKMHLMRDEMIASQTMLTNTISCSWAGNTYNVDELNESQSKRDLNLLSHVLHWSDQLVVAAEQVSHQPLLVPWPHSWNIVEYYLTTLRARLCLVWRCWQARNMFLMIQSELVMEWIQQPFSLWCLNLALHLSCNIFNNF